MPAARFTIHILHMMIVLAAPEVHPLVQPYLIDGLVRATLIDDPLKLQAQIWQRSPDMLLIESAPPHVVTIGLCGSLRRFFSFPILVVARAADEQARIGLLDSGADDLLSLERGLAELLARLKALRRRCDRQRRRNPHAGYLAALDMHLDVPGRRLMLPGATIDLSLAQTKLLALLFHSAGVVAEPLVAEHLFGSVSATTLRNTALVAGTLRRRLIQQHGIRPIVEKVRGGGYRLRQT